MIKEVCTELAIVKGLARGEQDLQSWVTLTRRLMFGSWRISSSSAVSPRCVLNRFTVAAGRSLRW